MAVQLRDGTEAEDRRLGRLVEYDERSKDYPVGPLLMGMADRVKTGQIRPRSYRWRIKEWHDQQKEGACVSFSLGHKISGRPAEKLNDIDFSDLVRYYRQAQLIDPWPETYHGGEEGTSILAGLKVLQEAGYFNSYRWILGHDQGLRDAILTLGYVGGLAVGSWWWSDMWRTDDNGFVRPTGHRVGGHAWYSYGIKIRDASNQYTSDITNVDLDNSVVYCRNSWGSSWGVNGDFKLTLRDWNFLRLDQGEAVLPVESGRYFHGKKIG